MSTHDVLGNEIGCRCLAERTIVYGGRHGLYALVDFFFLLRLLSLSASIRVEDVQQSSKRRAGPSGFPVEDFVVCKRVV